MTSPLVTPSGGTDAERAAAIAAELADVDLVGQMLVPSVYGHAATGVTPGSVVANRERTGVGTPAEIVARYRLGGVILV
ncbi:MAG TPA: hypothetical protein VGR21_00610, partial [Cryptosporangiaceae bacterium]|nr:hypothetical protein [Cryptosporangiaceae bacterium]